MFACSAYVGVIMFFRVASVKDANRLSHLLQLSVTAAMILTLLASLACSICSLNICFSLRAAVAAAARTQSCLNFVFVGHSRKSIALQALMRLPYFLQRCGSCAVDQHSDTIDCAVLLRCFVALFCLKCRVTRSAHCTAAVFTWHLSSCCCLISLKILLAPFKSLMTHLIRWASPLSITVTAIFRAVSRPGRTVLIDKVLQERDASPLCTPLLLGWTRALDGLQVMVGGGK